MPDALKVAGDIIVAATALAGFIFVYLGSVATSFDGYQKTEQNSVRSRYQMRAWLSFVGFVLALLSALFALLGEWLEQECLAGAALGLLFVSLMFVLYVTLATVKDIR